MAKRQPKGDPCEFCGEDAGPRGTDGYSALTTHACTECVAKYTAKQTPRAISDEKVTEAALAIANSGHFRPISSMETLRQLMRGILEKALS